MKHPQVADGGMASNVEGIHEYIEQAVVDTIRGGPPAWRLGKVLTTPPRKKLPCYKTFTIPSGLNLCCGTT